MIARSKILQPEEIEAALEYLRGKQHTKNGRLNLILFRLSCCCGLRASEIVGLNLGDLVVDGPCPTLTVRKECTKGKGSYGKKREIPLDMDEGTLNDIRGWYALRAEQVGGREDAPFVCGQSQGPQQVTMGNRLTRFLVGRRWKTVMQVLSEGRRKQLSIHKGRHTAISYHLAAGYDPVEIRDMAGHAGIGTTNRYSHSVGRKRLPSVFGFASRGHNPDQNAPQDT